MNHTKTTVHVWGEKRKREMLGITDGRGDVCPLPCTLCSVPSASLSPSARGKCLVWALKGKSSQKGGLGHGQSPPLFPS